MNAWITLLFEEATMEITEVRNMLDRHMEDRKLLEQYGRLLNFDPSNIIEVRSTPRELVSDQVTLLTRLGRLAPDILARRNVVAAMIVSIDDSLGRSIMCDRYLCFMDWEHIADKYHYSLPTVFKLHNKYIEQIAASFRKE